MNASTAIDAGSSSPWRIDGDQVFAPCRDFLVGKTRMPRHVGGEREHRGEILREAGRRERHLVPSGDHRQRRAAAVEIVGDRIRRSRHGAAIEHARAERRRAVAIGRIRIRAGTHADQHADRRGGVIRFRDDGDAVLERHPLGIQAGHTCDPITCARTFRLDYFFFGGLNASCTCLRMSL